MPSLEDLEKLIRESPEDPFPRYGLALELRKRGRLEDSLRAFEALLARFPDYVPGHQQRAQTLAAAGRTEEAREAFRHGIGAARGTGDHHAAEEMAAALEGLS